MKHPFRSVVVISFLAAIGGQFLTTRTTFEEHSSVHRGPLFALGEEWTMTAGGSRIAIFDRVIYARRSDGAEVRTFEQTYPAGQARLRLIRLPKRGLRVDVDDHLMAKTTWIETPSENERFHVAPLPSICTPGTLTAARGQLSSAVHVSNLRTVEHVEIRAQETVERWFAPELECFEIKRVTTWQNRAFAYTERLFHHVASEEPPAELFEVAPAYEEVTSGERAHRNNLFRGRTMINPGR